MLRCEHGKFNPTFPLEFMPDMGFKGCVRKVCGFF
jgi:hypothetical protein